MQNPRTKLEGYIEHYMQKWQFEDFRLASKTINRRNIPKSWPDAIVFLQYAPIMMHAMEERFPDFSSRTAKLKDMQSAMRKLFTGQTVVELGCRGGTFLKFAKSHGATSVLGTTDRSYEELLKQNLKPEEFIYAPIVKSAARIKSKNIRPTMVFSDNFFDKGRWWGARPPVKGFCSTLKSISSPGTHIFIRPSSDSGGAVITPDRLGQQINAKVAIKANIVPPNYGTGEVTDEVWSLRIPSRGTKQH